MAHLEDLETAATMPAFLVRVFRWTLTRRHALHDMGSCACLGFCTDHRDHRNPWEKMTYPSSHYGRLAQLPFSPARRIPDLAFLARGGKAIGSPSRTSGPTALFALQDRLVGGVIDADDVPHDDIRPGVEG
jgi:hypothetical protein